MIARLLDSTIELADDDGRPVRLEAGETIMRAAAGGDARAIRIWQEWANVGRDVPLLHRPGVIGGVGVCVVFMTFAATSPGIAPIGSRWYVFAAMGLVIGFAMRLPLLRSARRNAPKLIRTSLQEAICPACAYDLIAQELDANGRVRCPECGAAWRGERFAAPLGLGDRLAAATARGQIGRTLALLASGSRGRRGLDAREQPVRATLPPRRGRYADPEVARRAAAARRRARREGRWLRWPAGAVLMAPGVFLLGLAAAVPVISAVTGPILVLSALVTIAIGLAALFGDIGYSFRGLSRAMCQQGLCPQCGEDIAAYPCDADGLTTCAGCQAAWRVGQAPGVNPR